MREFLLNAVAKFENEIGEQRFPPVRTLHLVTDFVPQTTETPGIHAPTASSHLMKLPVAHNRT
eukprot:16446664-Heterocapsa_arctica.AAC.1